MKKLQILLVLPFVFMACSESNEPDPKILGKHELSFLDEIESTCSNCDSDEKCFLPGTDDAILYLNSLSANSTKTKAFPASECSAIDGWGDLNYLSITGERIGLGLNTTGCCYPETYLEDIWQDAYDWALTLGTPPDCPSPKEPFIGLEFVRVTGFGSTCDINVIVHFLCCAAEEEEEQS